MYNENLKKQIRKVIKVCRFPHLKVPATARGDKKNIGTFIGSHKSSDENEGSKIDSGRR